MAYKLMICNLFLKMQEPNLLTMLEGITTLGPTSRMIRNIVPATETERTFSEKKLAHQPWTRTRNRKGTTQE
jgi:hypothetical protein